MISLRKANDRGKMNIGWLEAAYSFSFASYYDPEWMGFSKLRVINEDFIAPGMGFDAHPHRDMEIISFILEGKLEHKDSMGEHAVIKPGEIQVMSAGTGVMHSEYNPDKENRTHSLQIWIEPKKMSIEPRYSQINIKSVLNTLNLIASESGGENIALINQDAKIYHGIYLSHNETLKLDKTRKYWLQVTKGNGHVNQLEINPGDGLAIESENELLINNSSDEQLEFLLFDLP